MKNGFGYILGFLITNAFANRGYDCVLFSTIVLDQK
jgi:hypothetical protein